MRVKATSPGYDNIKIREIGEEFDMPDNVFDKRPILGKDGKPSGKFYPPPSWFKPVTAKKAEKQDDANDKPVTAKKAEKQDDANDIV
jgi:hypothetical protein